MGTKEIGVQCRVLLEISCVALGKPLNACVHCSSDMSQQICSCMCYPCQHTCPRPKDMPMKTLWVVPSVVTLKTLVSDQVWSMLVGTGGCSMLENIPGQLCYSCVFNLPMPQFPYSKVSMAALPFLNFHICFVCFNCKFFRAGTMHT